MQSNTDLGKEMKCDFCLSRDLKVVYEVPDSLEKSYVAVCMSCGLVQSFKNSPYRPRNRHISISSGADWGNIRHGKSIRFDSIKSILEQKLSWADIDRVLDIGSNRGDFVQWVAETKNVSEIIGIEPDETIIGEGNHKDSVNIIVGRFENISLRSDYFDFVYCCHTLEHADSAREMIRKIHRCLKKGGHLFLEVPNIYVITKLDLLEEFFIDKHLFHFDPYVLKEFLDNEGFTEEMSSSGEDLYNISLILSKTSDAKGPFRLTNKGRAESHVQMVKDYSRRLRQNRENLKDLVRNRLVPFLKRQRVAFWGAGKIFDALVRFGQLDANLVHCLVDDYLFRLLPSLHGIPIHPSEVLKTYEPQVLIVLARNSSEDIIRKSRSMGIKNIITISQIMET